MELTANAVDRHLALKALYTTRGSATDGKDIAVTLPRCISSPNDIEINAAMVRTYRCQSGMNATMNSLSDQGIHSEAGLIKAKC